MTAATTPVIPADERPARRIGFGSRLTRWDIRFSPYLYVSPFFIVFGITGLFPLVFTAVVSLYDWNLIGGPGEFIGLKNFGWVLSQPQFWLALRNTISIFLLSSVPQIAFALVVAAALHTNLRAKTFWRMGVLVPYVIAPVAVALIFGQMFADNFGLINDILSDLGLPRVGWHTQAFPAHIAIATMVNFRWTGYSALIFLAGMQAIPQDYYEAAKIDGAGPVRQFFSITIPQLRPTIIFMVIISTVGGLQIFDEPRLYESIGLGGANGQWLTITLYLYQLGWKQLDFGKAAAVAWLLFLLIVLIGLVNLLITQRISTTTTARGAR